MKKLLILLLISTGGYVYSQDSRIKDLTQLSTYTDSANFIVDDSTDVVNDYTYRIPWCIVSPKIRHETTDFTTLNKNSTYLRFAGDTTGNAEYKTKLSYINPDIGSLPSDVSLTGADFLTFYDLTQTRDEYITYANFTTDITNESTFQTAINTDIDNRVTESYIIGIVQTEVNQTALTSGATTYGRMSLRRIGDIVCILIETINTTSEITVDESLPVGFMPSYAYTYLIGDLSNNFATIKADGTINLRVTNTYSNFITGAYIAQ